ncbi:MAG: TetR/AcrR family transcriptional regulator [Bacilli bacterium]
MKTERKLGNTLKTLMMTEPLEAITVKKIADRCRVNRQTFYYHFRNIYDLLTWIYLHEEIPAIEEASTWKEGLVRILEYVNENSEFITNTLASAGRELFIEFLYNTIYGSQLRIIDDLDVDNALEEETRKFISQFYAPSFVYVIVRWIDGGRVEKPEHLIAQLEVFASTYLTSAIDKFKKEEARP